MYIYMCMYVCIPGRVLHIFSSKVIVADCLLSPRLFLFHFVRIHFLRLCGLVPKLAAKELIKVSRPNETSAIELYTYVAPHVLHFAPNAV